MVKVNIRCPLCSQKGILNIDESMIQLKSSGLFSVSIDRNFTCEHAYIAYIDKDYNIRDYFNLDYNIVLPGIIAEEQTDNDLEELILNHDLDLFKLNLNANILTIIFKSIISKKLIFFIGDKYNYNDTIIPFFKAVSKDSFDFEINIIDEETYKNSKAKFKKELVLNPSTIINNPHKFIDLKRINVEKRIINAFIVEKDSIEGLRILKYHITQSYDIAILISDYIKNQAKAKNFYAKNIIDSLETTNGVIISTQYLDYLVEIVNYYFEIPLKLSMPNYTGVF